jgi:regulator of protease activity HflC (stomatin/prohibitin superfamily)
MGCCVCVEQGSVGILESLGKFDGVLPPGCSSVNCLTHEVKGTVALHTRMLTAEVQTPTADQADVHVSVGVMYRAIPSKCHLAFYRLGSAGDTIRSFIVSNLRPLIRSKTVDELYLERDSLSNAIKGELETILSSFGYEVVDLLILEMKLVGRVREAVNQQVLQFYARSIASHEGNIKRIVQLAHSEANVEIDRLNGVGTAEARRIISSAFRQGMAAGNVEGNEVEGPSESEVMAMMLLLQYYDMLSDLKRGKTIFMPLIRNPDSNAPPVAPPMPMRQM